MIASVASKTDLTTAQQADLSRLRDATERVVGSVFFGTMLRTMRESGPKPTYGHGGRGEEAFAGQLHDLLAERMATSRATDIGDVLYRRLEKNQRLITGQRAAAAEVARAYDGESR